LIFPHYKAKAISAKRRISMKIKLNFAIKALIIKSFAVLMIIGTLNSAAFSQTRVRFARGRTSATLSGTLSGYGSRSYVLGASRGQMMTVRVSSNSGRVWVDIGGNDVGRGTSVELRSTDDYIITVHNELGNATKYSLYVGIR
jgi:hypothetical protein